MKFLQFTIGIAALAALACAGGRADEATKKAPTSKIFLSESKGTGQIESNGKVFEPKQGTAFDAPGTVMMTNNDSHQAYVLSSGTGLYLDANSQVKISQFDQEKFESTHLAADVEPSVSHLNVLIMRGLIGLCASPMVSGTTVLFSTPLASVNIRGRRVAIKVSAEETSVYALEGSVTLRPGEKASGGVTLEPGEQAVVRPGGPGQEPQVAVGPIDNDLRSSLDGTVAVACNARKTVAFEAVDNGAAAPEIVPKPTVSATPPNNLTVSPDRLNPGP